LRSVIFFKRKAVYEQGFSVDKLYVERAGVFQDHALFDGEGEDRERMQGSVLQLPETPFIGVGDKG